MPPFVPIYNLKSVRGKKIVKDIEYRKVYGLVGDQSLSIVLPKSYALHLGLEKGNFVKVYEEKNKIVVEKAEN